MKRLNMPKIPTRIPVPDMPNFSSLRKKRGKYPAELPPLEDWEEPEPVDMEQPEAEAKGRPKLSMPKMPSMRKAKAHEEPEEVTEPQIASLGGEEDIEPQPSTREADEAPAEVKARGKPKLSAPKIPLPSISKPRLHKPGVPKIPLPSVSKPGRPRLSVPKFPLPSVSKPGRPRLSVPKFPLPGISIPVRSGKTPLQEESVQQWIDEEAAQVTPSADDDFTIDTEEEAGTKPASRKISMPSFRKHKEEPAIDIEDETADMVEEAPVMDEAPEEKPKAKGAPGIHMPAMPSFRKHKEKPVVYIEDETADMAEEAPKEKSKAKISMPKMPRVGMPGVSTGKGTTKSTGKHILALSIEGTDIRLLSYRNNAVESWQSIPIDARLLRMGHVSDPIALGEVIRGAITGIDAGRCYVMCAMPGLRSVSRIISVPNVSKKEMETVIPREVRRIMTVSEDDNYFHWEALPGEGAQTRVFVLAVPKEQMSLMLQAFSHAGLTPAQVDLKPMALMRAINQREAIIANCEGNSMEIVIVSNDVPVLIRSVFLGEDVITQDYAVGRISDELGRTIVTFNEINKESPLDQNTPVYLTGSVAAGVPFALNVAALTGRTVQPLEVPIDYPEDFPIAEYMVNIGLILKVV